MSERTLNNKELREVIDKIAASQMDKIKDEVFRKNSPFSKMFVGIDHGRGTSSAGLSVPRPQGSTELLDPDGKVIMRDDEIIEEKPITIAFSRQWVSRR